MTKEFLVQKNNRPFFGQFGDGCLTPNKGKIGYKIDEAINWSDIKTQIRSNPEQFNRALHFIRFSLGYLPEKHIHIPHLAFIQVLVGNVMFIVMCFKRQRETNYLALAYDFNHFTLSTGQIHPMFKRLNFLDIKFNRRTIETIIGPLFFLIIGLVLSLFDGLLGGLVTKYSILYSMSYFAQYHKGDHYMMDIIDKVICSEELGNTIIEGKESTETRGFSHTGRRPSNRDAGRKIVDEILGNDDFFDAV